MPGLAPGSSAFVKSSCSFPKKMHGGLTCMKVSSNHPDFLTDEGPRIAFVGKSGSDAKRCHPFLVGA